MDIILERVLSLLPKKENGDFEFGSKKKFAQMLGLPHNTISMWISGDNESYKKKLHQIADIYNVSVEWLKGETDIKVKPATETGDGQSDIPDDWQKMYFEATPDEIAQIKNYFGFLKSQRKN